MSAYGCYVKFTALPGQSDALVEHLLRAAAGVRSVAGCQLYLIKRLCVMAPRAIVWQSYPSAYAVNSPPGGRKFLPKHTGSTLIKLYDETFTV